MSYYQGDYYPRGDPGFLSFLGKGLSMFGGFVPGVGPLLSKAGSALSRVGTKAAPAAAGLATTGPTSAIIAKAGQLMMKHPVLSAAGAAGALAGTGALTGAMVERAAMGGAHRGHVLKKCGMVLKSGKIGKCHRRMNPFNPRAARRAGRRLHSLVRHYRKYVGFVSAKRPKGRAFFKARKRK